MVQTAVLVAFQPGTGVSVVINIDDPTTIGNVVKDMLGANPEVTVLFRAAMLETPDA